MDELLKAIFPLVNEEVARARSNYSEYRLTHEAWALLKEEIEETADELEVVKHWHAEAWELIKDNGDLNSIKSCILELQDAAMKCSAESIQAAAVSQRFLDFIEREARNE